jgi:hypothetical protein
MARSLVDSKSTPFNQSQKTVLLRDDGYGLNCTVRTTSAPWAQSSVLLTGSFPGLFMLVVSVLCLPAQIFLILWMHERDAIRGIVFIAGVFAMLPLLYVFPFPSRSLGGEGNPTPAPFPRGKGRVNSSCDGMLSALVPFPPPIYRPASRNIGLLLMV